MDSNTTTFSLASFKSVLAGGGTLVGGAGLIAVVVAVVYALCCRRGRVSFTRAGLTIEPSPPRSGSQDAAIPSIELPSHLGGNPPVEPIPKRQPKSKKTKAAEAPSESEPAEAAVGAPGVL